MEAECARKCPAHGAEVPQSPPPSLQSCSGRPSLMLCWARTKLIRIARPWPLLSALASGQAFASRNVLLSSFPWRLSTGWPLRVRARQALAGMGLRLLKANVPSRSGLCSFWLSPGQLRPSALLSRLLSFLRTHRITALPGPVLARLPFSLHLHLEPGGIATLCQPIYPLRPRHGNTKKQALLPG